MKAKIEIEKGTKIKKELHSGGDDDTTLHAECPAYYGYMIDTLAEDGDPKDIIIFTDEDLQLGDIIEVDPQGFIEMTDNGQQDNKYFCFKGSHIDFKQLIDVKRFIAQYKEIQGDTIEFGNIIYTK